jgi:energy-coupling factor transporter ATP-binding protein EcfA2
MDQKIEEIEAFAEIGEFIDQPVKMYSSGMFVRLAFASAINVDPDILVIDEALAVGDMVFQHRCMSKIRDLKKKKNIVFVSHDISTVVSLCDKVIWLDAGRIREIGAPKSVSERYQAYVYELSQRFITSHYTSKHEDFGRFGDKRAKIVAMKILDSEGKGVNALWPGSIVNLEILTEGVETIIKPMIGFTVRDRLGNDICSTNSFLEGLAVPQLNASERVLVRFTFPWPRIMPSSYSFSPYVADGTPEEHSIGDWVYDAVVLTANTDKSIVGVVGLNDVKASCYAVNVKPKEFVL